MDMYQLDDGILVSRKNAYPVKQRGEGTVPTGSGLSRDIPGTPEDAHISSGQACAGMTLACSVYRTIEQLEKLCRE